MKSFHAAIEHTYNNTTGYPNNQLNMGSVSYDANGDLLTDNLDSTYSWDPNWGNMLSVTPFSSSQISATYDALGRMVEQHSGSTHQQILFSPAGKTALMNGSSLTKAFIPLPGGGTAIYNSGGLAYYRHPDWLGSSRLTSTQTRGLYSSQAYAPFGSAYQTAGASGPTSSPVDPNFTGQNSDTVPTLYDFPSREQSMSQGPLDFS
jgi:YD repeat-containing protein